MKTHLPLTFFLLALTQGVYAQQSVPNGNFENWNHTQFDEPKYYGGSNGEAHTYGLSFNCIKSTDAYHGSSSVQLTTVANNMDTIFGYFINTDANGDPSEWHGGAPINEKPTGIRGYYKSNIAAGDTGIILVAFSKLGMNIGNYMIPVVGNHTTFTLFDYTFSPALSVTPDSVIFAAVSSMAFGETYIPGSTLTIDSISLTGITTQPPMLNGDFEEWNTVAIDVPVDWYANEGRQSDVTKSADAYKGAYAVELKTREGDNDGVPVARGARLGTGYYERNCESNCNLVGGYPFTLTADTLALWYKYASVGNAKASVYLSLKKNQSQIGGAWFSLSGSAAYQYIELPFSSSQIPDTLVIEISSNRWEDSLLSQIGSVLIVDGLHLKSQPFTGLPKTDMANVKVSVYPNPVTDYLNINFEKGLPTGNYTFSIYNVLGQELHSIKLSQSNNTILLDGFAKGTYMYTIRVESTTIKKGKIVLSK